MKNRLIYENLDTSFVNLSALVKYLCRRDFVGNIRIELSGYEADISLTAEREMRVCEHDRFAGRISEGEEALQRLLIRAREPGGIINVYQSAEKAAPPPEKTIEKTAPFAEAIPTIVAEACQTLVTVPAKLPHQNGNSKIHQNGSSKVHQNGNSKPYQNGNSKIVHTEPLVEIKLPVEVEPSAAEDEAPEPDAAANAEQLPFELSNNCEARAKQNNLALPDWQMLLNLTAELLSTIDKSLAEANLEFTAAFEKARTEISDDYPFLNPAANVFDYKNGKIIVRQQINGTIFTASINETLRRILDKLGRNPKFSNVYLVTAHRILALIEKRRPLYEKFSITPQLAKIIGI